jgi:hypothetical protein
LAVKNKKEVGMSWISKGIKTLFSGGAGKVIETAGKAFDDNFTNDEERMQAQASLNEIAQKPATQQHEINKLESQHQSVWNSGWRPGIGWVCCVSLALFYIPQFLMAAVIWGLAIYNNGFVTMPAYPANADGVLELVMALLGMATIRMAERLNGVARL